jgi:hypothetical protein
VFSSRGASGALEISVWVSFEFFFQTFFHSKTSKLGRSPPAGDPTTSWHGINQELENVGVIFHWGVEPAIASTLNFVAMWNILTNSNHNISNYCDGEKMFELSFFIALVAAHNSNINFSPMDLAWAGVEGMNLMNYLQLPSTSSLQPGWRWKI